MKLIINHSSMQPIYEQISGQIKDLIIHGELTEGAVLPSVRVLARELRVSALTVKKSYDTLEQEGFVTTVHGKGSFVSSAGQAQFLEEKRREVEAELEAAIRPDTVLVSIILVNNETGTVQDAAAIGKLIKEKNPQTLFHLDAVQAFGKYPIDVEKMKADLLTMSGHKIHGPKGTGMLYMRKGLKVKPLMLGGGQQKGQRPGTENGPGAAALGVAADAAFSSLKESIEAVREVKKILLDGILAMPDTQLNGDGLDTASPYVLNVTFKGLRSEVLLHALESKGIVVSAGSACDSKKKVGSPVLTAMGLHFAEIEGAVRFIFCRHNTAEEARECLKVLEELVPFLRKYNR